MAIPYLEGIELAFGFLMAFVLSGQPVYLVAARNTEALSALMRGLPHYGRRGWVVFDGARAADKGQWPADASPLVRDFGN